VRPPTVGHELTQPLRSKQGDDVQREMLPVTLQRRALQSRIRARLQPEAARFGDGGARPIGGVDSFAQLHRHCSVMSLGVSPALKCLQPALAASVDKASTSGNIGQRPPSDAT